MISAIAGSLSVLCAGRIQCISDNCEGYGGDGPGTNRRGPADDEYRPRLADDLNSIVTSTVNVRASRIKV